MAVQTTTQFDVDAFRRGYEEWDVEALLGLYADDVELVQIDRDNPPSRRASATARRRCAGCSSTAPPPGSPPPWGRHRRRQPRRRHGDVQFPGGRSVAANTILELEDGRIVRERLIQAGDPK